MPPVMHGKLERPRSLLSHKRPRKNKEQFECGERFSGRAPDFLFESWGDVDKKLGITLLSISIYPRTQCDSGAMKNSTCKAWFNISLTQSAAGAVARPLHPRRLKIGDVKIED